MKSFHSTKRESTILGFLGVSILFIISCTFMFIGSITVFHESTFNLISLVIALIGVALFVLFMRGAWSLTKGAKIHIFSVTEEEVEWGVMGKEQRLSTSEIKEFYWNEIDGLTFYITKNDGKRVRFPYIEYVIKYKNRPKLLDFLRTTFPDVPVTGSEDPD